MVDDVVVHQLLHEADARLSVWCFFVVNQPVCELLGHEAVWVRSEVITSVLNELPIMEAKPRKKDSCAQQLLQGNLGLITQHLPSLEKMLMIWEFWPAPSDL